MNFSEMLNQALNYIQLHPWEILVTSLLVFFLFTKFLKAYLRVLGMLTLTALIVLAVLGWGRAVSNSKPSAVQAPSSDGR